MCGATDELAFKRRWLLIWFYRSFERAHGAFEKHLLLRLLQLTLFCKFAKLTDLRLPLTGLLGCKLLQTTTPLCSQNTSNSILSKCRFPDQRKQCDNGKQTEEVIHCSSNDDWGSRVDGMLHRDVVRFRPSGGCYRIREVYFL